MPSTATHTITVNDQSRTVEHSTTLAALVAEMGLGDRKGVAVAVNGTVVPRSTWSTHLFSDGDRVLVIRATQGG